MARIDKEKTEKKKNKKTIKEKYGYQEYQEWRELMTLPLIFPRWPGTLGVDDYDFTSQYMGS